MASRRLSWQIPRIAVAITVNLRLRRIAVDSRGNCRRLTWQLPLIAIEIAVATCRCLPWKLPWQLPRKLPWQSSRNVVVCRGNCRRLPFVKIAVDCRKLPFVKCGNRRGNSHGWPRDVVVFRGNCNGLASVEIAVAIALDYRGNCRVLPCHLPWQLPWNAVAFAVDCRGLPWIAAAIDVGVAMEYAVAVAVVLRWVAMAGPMEVATDRTAARAMAKPWHLLWKPADFHGSPWQDPWKITDVPRSLTRPSKTSNNVHPWHTLGHGAWGIGHWHRIVPCPPRSSHAV